MVGKTRANIHTILYFLYVCIMYVYVVLLPTVLFFLTNSYTLCDFLFDLVIFAVPLCVNLALSKLMQKI